MKAATLLSLLILSEFSSGGDLVVKGNPRGTVLWLLPLATKHLAPAKEAGPWGADNHREGLAGSPFQWKEIKPGSYLILVDFDQRIWDSECIAAVPVEVGEAAKTVEVKLPSGSLDLAVNFEGVKAPRQYGSEGLVLRVEKLQADGSIEPYFCRYFRTEKKDGKFGGTLGYLAPGDYRVTAFSHEDMEAADVAWGAIHVDEALLREGKANVTISKMVGEAAPSRGAKPAN